jgi:hypothetical protein
MQNGTPNNYAVQCLEGEIVQNNHFHKNKDKVELVGPKKKDTFCFQTCIACTSFPCCNASSGRFDVNASS